jgi:hypothetical protein
MGAGVFDEGEQPHKTMSARSAGALMRPTLEFVASTIPRF